MAGIRRSRLWLYSFPMGDLRTPGVLVSLTSWTVAEELYRYDPGDGTSRALNLRPLGPYDHPSNLVSEELKVKSYDGALVDFRLAQFGATLAC
jgi:hypothetical protein